MRVLYFSRSYTPHDHRFLSALSETEHEIFFLQLESGKRQLEDRILPDKVQQVRWRESSQQIGWLDYCALRRALKQVLIKLKPDLVHAGPIQLGAFLTALTGFKPLVTMSWGSDLLKDARRSRLYRWITHFTLRRSDVLVGDCQAVADEAVQYGVAPEKIVLFPWGVDLEQFQPGESQDFRRRLGWEDRFIILSNRSWEPIYGVDNFLRGFVAAARQNSDLRLLLLGGGSQSVLLKKILLDAGMLDRVHFGGQVSQDSLTRYYQAADLYVSASHSDGSSVSLLEALACALPVLVSDIPGNREWVEPGKQGWLFPDGDKERIAQGILAAYEQRENLHHFGRAGRALAEQRADWSQNFKQLLKAYQIGLAARQEKNV